MPEQAPLERVTIRDEAGEVVQDASMKDGLLEGQTVLYSHGRVAGRLQFHAGRQEGESIYYDEAGRVSVKASYRAGKLHGVSSYFDPHGRIIRKATYKNGDLNGRAIDYYPSGKPREASHYEGNLLEGELLRLEEGGKVTERIQYHRGRPRRRPPCVPQVPASAAAVKE